MDEGFQIHDKGQLLIWWKTVAFEVGISPAEFRKSRISDIKEIMEIKVAMGMKEQRNKKVQDLMSKVRF